MPAPTLPTARRSIVKTATRTTARKKNSSITGATATTATRVGQPPRVAEPAVDERIRRERGAARGGLFDPALGEAQRAAERDRVEQIESAEPQQARRA